MKEILQLIERETEGNIIVLDESFKKVRFFDIMDIVLYFISLQEDLKKISQIKEEDFLNLLKVVFENEGDFFKNYSWIKGGWESMRIYFKYFPFLFKTENLYDFFENPKGWEIYKNQYIHKYTFLKWKESLGEINNVFEFAEKVCEALRKEALSR